MSLAILFLLFLFAFTIATLVTIVGAAVISRRPQPAMLTGIEGQPANPNGSSDWMGDLPGLFKSDELSTISFWDDWLKRLDIIDLLTTRLAQAELNWSPGRVTLGMLLCGTIALAIVWRVPVIPLWLAVIAVPAASVLPYLFILNRRDKRFRRFKSLFPDALDSFARALRSGAPVAAGLEIVANESEAPVSTEIRKTT